MAGHPHNGILIPQQQPGQLVVNGGPLMNDIQLIAMVAGYTGLEDPKEAVDYALECVARACAAVQAGAIQKRVAELQEKGF